MEREGEADSGQPRACGREAKTVWLPGTGQKGVGGCGVF